MYKIIKNKLEFNSNDSINEAIKYNANTDYYNTYYRNYHEKINIIDYNDDINIIENISFIYPYKSLCYNFNINHVFYDIKYNIKSHD